jgi:ABC-type dipeptide/oligopeptide/nickel transport system permease subunit
MAADDRLAEPLEGRPADLGLQEPGLPRTLLRFCAANPRIPLFGLIIGTILVACLLAPLLAPYDPRAVDTPVRLQGPSAAHILGTDQLGRDTFSRVLHGGRLSLFVGIAAVSGAAVFGIGLGIAAGYFGGPLDDLSGRVVDAQLAFPELILAIALVNAFGTSIFNVILVLGLTYYPQYYRLARGQVLQAREFEYVTAVRSLGGSGLRVLGRHILPNVLSPLIIAFSFALGGAVLVQASLGFLGLGPKAGTPDWGLMFLDALNNYRLQPWLIFGPGLAVFVSVLSFYVLGDAFRDALDPKLRASRVKGAW